MPKVTYHEEGELPEEPEREPKTMLQIDTPSTGAIIEQLESVGDEAMRTTEALEAAGLSSIDGINTVISDQAATEETQEIEVNNTNEFGLGGQMDRIRPIMFPEFTTRQQAWRFAAWLKLMAETLPEETHNHTFEEIEEAIKNGG